MPMQLGRDLAEAMCYWNRRCRSGKTSWANQAGRPGGNRVQPGFRGE